MVSGNSGEGLTYRRSGVDIDRAAGLVERFKDLAAAATRPEVMAAVGGFAGCFRLPAGMNRPVLLAATDGVGTKLLLARQAGALEGAGRDLVAMSVNDIVVYGAETWVFLDTLSTGRLKEEEAVAAVTGIAAACREAGCALLGGETAELPGMLREDDLDLVGFALGGVDEDRLIDGKGVRPGDAIIGLAASGPHSNGFSLIRQALPAAGGWRLDRHVQELGAPLGQVLLEPTRIYVKPVLAACGDLPVRAMAHITGGGLPGNLPRTLPRGVRARLRPGAWPRPPIFDLLQRVGRIAEAEMRRTFNLGVGFTLVVPPDRADEACRRLGAACGGAWIIGEIEVAGDGEPEVVWA